MSHFAVAVLSDGTKTIEELLAPYQENNMGTCPKEYLEFVDTEAEGRQSYETKSVEMVRLPNGDLVYPWSLSREDSEGCEKVLIAHKEYYKSFDEFMREWYDYTKNEETGKYGFWANPKSKWDYWSVESRWQNGLKLKDGSESNEAKIKDIDFSMLNSFVTYACVTPDGEWHSKGDMDWFGCSSETPVVAADWDMNFYNAFLKTADPEWTLTIVDCHI